MNFTINKAKLEEKSEIVKVLESRNMHHAFYLDSEDIDLSNFFVAKHAENIVGVAGYSLLSPTRGRTRLLAVYPDFTGFGIGRALQEARLEEMYKVGVTKIESRSDNKSSILWYKKHFGYKEIGKRLKSDKAGATDALYSIILELDLVEYMKTKSDIENQKTEYICSNDAHPLSPYSPVIINVALTGIIPSKSLTPFVPLTVDEIVEDAINVHEAGATVVHIHARDSEGRPTSDAHIIEKIITTLRKETPKLVCCVSTSGRGGQNFEQRAEVLHLEGDAKPDMASLVLGSLNFTSGPSITSFETIQQFALLMKEKRIKPELEIFDSGMVNIAKYLERNRLIIGKKYFNILLGNINTAAATINELSHITSELPANSIWAGGGLGSFQIPINIASLAAGGHVRVGLEDNVYDDTRRMRLATNRSQVERIIRIAKELGRSIATPEYTNEALGLNEI